MPRWISHLLIGGYVAALGFGLFAHAFTFLKSAHPAMYFIVWDMYCGWSAYEQRLHVLGEGESGAYYELAPGPWGDFSAFGSCGRHHYDVFGQFAQRIARNTLDHTEHEPILRVLLVEEAWPKKYNLPDELWTLQHAGPKDPRSYYHLCSVYAPDGRCLHRGADFIARQYELSVMSNPRLRSDMRKGHTIFAANPGDVPPSGVVPASWESPEN